MTAGVRAQTAHFTNRRESPRHVHHECVFSLAGAGASEIDCGHCRGTHVFKSGGLLLTEAHQVYASRALGRAPWRNYSVSITKEKPASLLGSASEGAQATLPHYTEGAVRHDGLLRLFLRLHDSLAAESGALEPESLLLGWVVAVNEVYADRPSHFHARRVYSESEAVRRAR